MYTNAMRTRKRNTVGAAMAEFAPTFLVFILLLAFPLINYMALALIWGAGTILNFNCVREASLVRHTTDAQGKPVPDTVTMLQRVQRMESDWEQNGFGRFIKLTAPSSPAPQGSTVTGNVLTNITPQVHDQQSDPNGDDYVRVDQVMDVQPFLMIPFPMQVPGINANIKLQFSSQRMIENG